MLQLHCPALFRGNQQIVAPLELSLPRGSLIGLTGPNGSGKSTLLRAMAGLAPEKARVTRQGRPLSEREVVLLPQAFAVRSNLSVLDCILLGQRERLGLRIPPDMLDRAMNLLEKMGLGDLANRPMNGLSGGQQQRVLIAQRLFREPSLLLMDEPTSALDLHHQLAVLELLRDHARDSGTVIVTALHDLTLAARFCGRLLVLADGDIRSDGPSDVALSRQVIESCWKISPEFLRDQANHLVVVPHPVPDAAARQRDNTVPFSKHQQRRCA